jgi:hypothetical protein
LRGFCFPARQRDGRAVPKVRRGDWAKVVHHLQTLAMTKLTIGLVIALVASNVAWLCHFVDRGVTEKYRGQELYELTQRNHEFSRLASEAVRGKTVAEVKEMLARQLPDTGPYVKEGQLHTTWMAMPIGDDGRVREVTPD